MVSEVIVSGVGDIVDCAGTGLMIVSGDTGLMIVSAVAIAGFEGGIDHDKDVSWYSCEAIGCIDSWIIGLFSGAIDEISLFEIIDIFQNTGVSSMLGD